MRRSFIPLIVSLCVVLLIVGLVGCGGDDPAGPNTDPGPDWPDAVALPTADEAAMVEVTDVLKALRDDLGIATARDSLLARIEDGWLGISEAHFGSDGTSLTLEFPDGVSVVVFTDEREIGIWPTPQGADKSRIDDAPLSAMNIMIASGCGDIVIPPTRKVHIVNTAGASNPEFREYADDLEKYLMQLGWGDDEVDVTQRESFDDRSITPDTVFDQMGYGIVILIGHGGFRYDEAGAEHFVFQGFRGGPWSGGYQEHVTESRWQEYIQWIQEGKMCGGSAWCEEDDDYQTHISLRDDLIAQEMKLEEGAMVAFMSCNSWSLNDELTAKGAGSVLGWDGSTISTDVTDSLNKLFEGLASEDGALGSDAAILDWMNEDGYGYSTGRQGEKVVFQLGGDERTWSLPTTLDFDAPGACMPEGTHHYDIDVNFPDCPERNTTLQHTPGSESPLTNLPPTGVEIELRAKDSSGNTLGAGVYDVDLGPNGNVFDLCPCEGGLVLDLTDYPSSGDFTAATAHIDVSYDDPTLGGESFDLGLPLTSLEGLVPGGVTLDVSVLTTSGDELGTTTVGEDVGCDDPRTISFCVGWLSISAESCPTEATEIVVTAPGEAGALPVSLSMPPGGVGGMYGFALGSAVVIEAEAVNGVGVSLGTTSTVVTVSCGPNEVTLDFAVYGIILETSPAWVPADGTSQATITATLRAFQEGDLFEPTGDPIVGKPVEFDASCGDFVGAAMGTTDGDGEVTVHLASEESCMAVVHALVMEDLVESRPAYVNFEARMSFWIDGTSSAVVDDSDGRTFVLRCGTLRFYFNDQFIIERLIATYHGQWGAYNPGWALPGDRIRLEISPWVDPDHYDCYDDSRTDLGASWVHTAYEPDLVHQGVHQLGAANSLNGTVDMEVTAAEIDHYGDKSGSAAPRDLSGLFALFEDLGEGETTVRWLPLRQACD